MEVVCLVQDMLCIHIHNNFTESLYFRPLSHSKSSFLGGNLYLSLRCFSTWGSSVNKACPYLCLPPSPNHLFYHHLFFFVTSILTCYSHLDICLPFAFNFMFKIFFFRILFLFILEICLCDLIVFYIKLFFSCLIFVFSCGFSFCNS
jgi:hypothetical protein